MDANELYSVSISPLITKSFALEWSQDNHISVITHRGVHVFELVPHPMCISPTFRFWRTFIHASEFVPAEAFKNLVQTALWKKDRESIIELLMQPSVTPRIEEKVDLEPRITKVRWSPLEMADGSNCLLAIVTSAGSGEILYKFGNDWLSLWNLTKFQYEITKRDTNFDAETIVENEFSMISWDERIKRLLCTAIDWSPFFRENDGSTPFAHLVAAFRGGDVIFFRVKSVSQLGKAEEPVVAHKTNLTSDVKINELLWIDFGTDNHVIVVGYADGRIHGLRIVVKNGIFSNEKIFKYHDEGDRIIPSSMKLIRDGSNDERRIVLVTKGLWLFVLGIDEDGRCEKIRHLRVGNFPITGLALVGTDTVILTTQNSKMYTAKITKNEPLTCKVVKNHLKSTKVQYLGLTNSHNATIFVNATSPDAMYDHLINREPSTLQMFHLTDDDLNPWKIIETTKKNEKITLHKLWDCFESIRVRSSRSIEPTSKFSEIPQNLENLSLHELRATMWLTVINQVSSKKQLLKGVEKIVGEISEAQPLIFLLSACEHLRRLAMKKNLRNDEKRCVSFLRMYLEIYQAGNDADDDDDEDADENLEGNEIGRKIREALNLTSNVDSIEIEACNICDEIITDLPWTVKNCPVGHKLQRCSLTLLQIDSVRYRICPVCERLYHPSLDDDYRQIRCIYCDVPAQYDSRVTNDVDANVEKRWNNLSKKRENNGETKNFENDGTNVPNSSSCNEKIKKLEMHPHTFAVIVNKDDDDSFITETWQEF